MQLARSVDLIGQAAGTRGPMQLSTRWSLQRPLTRRPALIASAEPGKEDLHSRLGSLRRPNPPANRQQPQSVPGDLQQLRTSSENLRMLLERRAQRRQPSLSPPPAEAPAAYQPPDAPAAAEAVPSSYAAAPAPTGAGPLSVRGPGGADVDASGGLRRVCKVRFWLKYRAEWGQRLKIVGSHEHLGAWKLEDGPELRWSEGDMWHSTVEVPAGTIVEYKYVLLDHSGQHAVSWQRGNNSVLAVRQSDEFVEVFDNWGGDPGAKVVSEGEAPTTRENRLLSWAGELEAQVVTQRAELRRARMELVASQEDAKLARQDALRYRAQLAQREEELTAALAREQDLKVTNSVLQAQLEDVTKSFRSALETAAELLQETTDAVSDAEDSGSEAEEKGEDAVLQQQQQQPPRVNGFASRPAPPSAISRGSSGSGSNSGGPMMSAGAAPPAVSNPAGGAGKAGGLQSGKGQGLAAAPKRSRGRPRRALPLPESGAAATDHAVVKPRPYKPRATGSSTAAAAAVPQAAPATPTPPARVGGGSSSKVSGGSASKEAKPVGGGMVATPMSARGAPTRGPRQAVRVAAVPVVGSPVAAASEMTLAAAMGWRSGQRLKLSRELARAGEPAQLDTSDEQ